MNSKNHNYLQLLEIQFLLVELGFTRGKVYGLGFIEGPFLPETLSRKEYRSIVVTKSIYEVKVLIDQS